jgi:hypothetical protein
MRLDCPVIHDASNIRSSSVDVIDRNFASNSVGNAITMKVTPRLCTTGASSVSKRLSFGGPQPDGNAHYFYSVSIPPTFNGQWSAIITYRVVEND